MTKRSKIAAMTVALMTTATILAPTSQAGMQLGNYDLLTNRYTLATWYWFVTVCIPEKNADCVYVSAAPRRKFYDYYQSKAYLANGRYTFTTDVPDGLRCFNQALPTHETYSWDAVTLAGTIESRYDVGCFNGPPGMQFWTFALQRL